jgi:hypothetical protein
MGKHTFIYNRQRRRNTNHRAKKSPPPDDAEKKHDSGEWKRREKEMKWNALQLIGPGPKIASTLEEVHGGSD